MTSSGLALPLGRTGVVAAASAAFGAMLVLALVGAVHLAGGTGSARATSGGVHVYNAPGHAFSIAVPSGWSALSGDALARVPGAPAAVLRRSDGQGAVIVRRIPAVTGDLRTVARDLTVELKRRVPGFRLVSARLGRVRAGGAFLYTFVRAGGAAQSLAVTTVRGATYRVDSIVAAGLPDAARQAGAAVGSFGP
ncbi:MAG: hypothetical protein QOC77_2935 [Thermoleophilaceae bacterium]|nr:hypothetical protein [Thermoleophilaceae bacterium]MEA2429192.1 hypothetical protein [Thermoleophilaceae bacterium]MEA2471950.1 hypothetical protein [Thermoleophilaceae bacterium]